MLQPGIIVAKTGKAGVNALAEARRRAGRGAADLQDTRQTGGAVTMLSYVRGLGGGLIKGNSFILQ